MMKKNILYLLAAVLACVCSLSCLAQQPLPEEAALQSKAASEAAGDDPFETGNRFIFSLNRAVDSFTLKPAAQLYKGIFPKYIRQGVTNFYSNLGEIRNSFNNILQGNAEGTAHNVARLVVNSTVGILGFYDPAGNYFEITADEQNFADTLDKYNVPLGPYLVVPVIGPSTVRNLPAYIVDIVLNPVAWIGSEGLQNTLIAGHLIEARESYLTEEEFIDALGADLYDAARQYYLNKYQLSKDAEDIQGYDGLDDLSESMDSFFPNLVSNTKPQPAKGR